jgi:hypothetical protein
VEAEFCGRILATHDDLGRWDADTDGLCWAVARIEGLSDAIHHAEELDCVRLIINRGVRVFAWSRAGAAAPGGALEHRLTLGVLLDWLDQERRAEGAPTAIDLAHTRLMERLAALEWFEAEPGRAAGVLPVVRYPLDQRDPSAPMSSEEVRRWRALGAFVGFALVGPEPQAPEALRDAIRSITRLPWNGNPEPGCEGLALSTGFLREGHTITGLGDVESIGRWLLEAFGPPDGRWLACETGRTLVRRIFTKP